MNFFFVMFFAVFILILVKLVNIQILESEKYKIAARKQYESKITLKPYRGQIYDRNMNVLVSNSYEYSFAADPNMVDNPERVAEIFSGAFGKSKNEYLEKLATPNTSFVYLERKIAPERLNGLDTLDISGVIVLKEPKRNYNYGALASQVLGFTNIDNIGQSGVELLMESELAGKEGYVIMQRDGKGNVRPSLEFPRKEAENGNNIVLTLDINFQRFSEEELEQGVKEFNADGGKVIIQAVKTGEILAMTSYPTFNPNSITSADTAGMKNAVITDVYEPGSTFKLITAAASLEEKIEDRNSIIATENMNGIKGLNIKDVHQASSMTFQQAIEQSSNVGFSKISLKLGKEKFYKYARDFGFGIYSGLELPAENKGMLKRPIDFSGVSLPYMSIGYEVLVNAMQLTNAYSSIANNGMMMKPYIVMKETGNDWSVKFENSPTQLRQVVSEKTAKTLTSLLTGVVERGTGMDAKLENVTVAGKTGTAQRLINGEYSSSSHNATFIGFFPAEDPQVIISVILNNPKSGEYYGGKVAAPVFKKIAQRIIGFCGTDDITKKNFVSVNYHKGSEESKSADSRSHELLVPNVLNLKTTDAIAILDENKFKHEIIREDASVNIGNADSYVVSQYPSPNERVIQGDSSVIKLVIKKGMDGEERLIAVPDVKQMSLRKAINILLMEGFDIDINGSGMIVDQSPEAGSRELPKSKIILYCKNTQ